MELAPFGIRVVTIQPDGVQTRFGAHAAAAIRLAADSLYQPAKDGTLARAQAGQQGAVHAQQFVRPVFRALLANRPPAVVHGGTNSIRLPLLKRLLPTFVFDAAWSACFGLDRLRG